MELLETLLLIEYIPLQQGLRLNHLHFLGAVSLIEYIPLQQGLRRPMFFDYGFGPFPSLSIFHYNKD